MKYLLIIVLCLIFLLLPFMKRKDAEKVKKEELEKVRSKFVRSVKYAKKRKDFEKLILKTDFYAPLLEGDSLRVLIALGEETRDVLYSENWSDEEVDNCKDIVKRIIT